MRIPKDGFFAHQVMWNGWVDPAEPKAHILGHWNYDPEVVKDVYVVSNTEAVELRVNGRSLGTGERSHRFLFTFEDVPWEAGVIEAIGLDKGGNERCVARHETAGPPTALRLERVNPEHPFRADGADLLLLQVEVVDAEGRRCPTALHQIDFTLDGPAEWRGGIAQGPDNYILAQSLPVEGGVNRVLVRSTTESGAIGVRAQAEGLKGNSLTVESRSVEVADGWSRAFPAEHLRGSLDQGPTPAGSSVTPTRRAVAGRSVTAESGESPEQAFDDNESTAWTGQGSITFQLDRQAHLNEITMKTGGFRARSYPIRVKVGEKVAYVGATSRSLGYITLPLEPTTGERVTIEILAGSEARDAFGDITELVDQGNATTGEESVGEAELSIIEIEFYEPI